MCVQMSANTKVQMCGWHKHMGVCQSVGVRKGVGGANTCIHETVQVGTSAMWKPEDTLWCSWPDTITFVC